MEKDPTIYEYLKKHYANDALIAILTAINPHIVNIHVSEAKKMVMDSKCCGVCKYMDDRYHCQKQYKIESLTNTCKEWEGVELPND